LAAAQGQDAIGVDDLVRLRFTCVAREKTCECDRSDRQRWAESKWYNHVERSAGSKKYSPMHAAFGVRRKRIN
jgi:hypothetical protein